MAVTGHRATVADSVPDADTVPRAGCAQSASAPSISTNNSGADVGIDTAAGVLYRPYTRCTSTTATTSSFATPPQVVQRSPWAFGSGARTPSLISSRGEGGGEGVRAARRGSVATRRCCPPRGRPYIGERPQATTARPCRGPPCGHDGHLPAASAPGRGDITARPRPARSAPRGLGDERPTPRTWPRDPRQPCACCRARRGTARVEGRHRGPARPRRGRAARRTSA